MIEAGASSKLFKPVFREAITPAAPSPTSTMFIPIKRFLLQVTVMGCYKLRNTKQMSPYVCIEYANSVFRTENGCDGTVIQLVEGVVEMVVSVWSSNTEGEKLIGVGRILLEEVLSQGYDDSLWELHCGNGRFAGVIQLKMQLSPENAHSLGVLETPFEVEFRKSITPAAVPYHTPASPSIPVAPTYAPDYPQKHRSFDNEEMKRRSSDFEVVSEHLLSNCQEMEEHRLSDFDVVLEEHKLSNYEGMEEHKLFDYEAVWERY